jgi:hypothetical protein
MRLVHCLFSSGVNLRSFFYFSGFEVPDLLHLQALGGKAPVP